MQKTKVLMYYSFPDMVGGPATYIKTIINSELNKEYEFATCYQNCAPGGVNFPLLFRMVKQIKEQKPDIVHVHGLQSEGFYGVLAARLAGCKNIVTTVHGFAFDAQSISKIKHFLYRRIFEPLTLRMSSKVYCVCDYASRRDIITRNTGKNNCGYIHNPVPQMVVDESRENIRNRLGIRDDEKVFAISGRVVRDKGFDILSKSIKELNSRGYKFKVLVIGDGNYREKFESELSDEISQNQVIMVGQTNKVADYLNASDMFVLPSYHENLPISIIEAGMMGLPCIISNVGGCPEIINNEISGFVVERQDFMLYADKMAELLDKPELFAKMKEEVKKDTQMRFNMSVFCEKLRKIYRF